MMKTVDKEKKNERVKYYDVVHCDYALRTPK